MRLWHALLGGLVLAAAGCSTSETASDVSGTVLMDGQPLPDGEIIFETADAAQAPAAGPITNGKYAVRATPGAKKVRIQSSRPAAKGDSLMGSAVREARLGSEYHAKSKLTADLKPGKNEGVDFQVKELPKK